jgi:hypothetical protein
MAPHSRRVFSREVCYQYAALIKRGRRECRALDAPAAWRAKRVEGAHQHYSPRVYRKHPAFPAQWFTAYFVLSPVNRAFLPPSSAELLPADLDTSVGVSGPHDFAVRDPSTPKASQGRMPVRRSFGEGGKSALVSRRPTSIASHPAFVTFAKHPSVGWDTMDIRDDLRFCKSEYFYERGLTGPPHQMHGGKSRRGGEGSDPHPEERA